MIAKLIAIKIYFLKEIKIKKYLWWNKTSKSDLFNQWFNQIAHQTIILINW